VTDYEVGKTPMAINTPLNLLHENEADYHDTHYGASDYGP